MPAKFEILVKVSIAYIFLVVLCDISGNFGTLLALFISNTPSNHAFSYTNSSFGVVQAKYLSWKTGFKNRRAVALGVALRSCTKRCTSRFRPGYHSFSELSFIYQVSTTEALKERNGGPYTIYDRSLPSTHLSSLTVKPISIYAKIF